MVVWIDDTLGIEVVGIASGTANFAHLLTANREQADTFARMADFPQYGLTVRPQREDDPRIRKGITDWETLHDAFHRACNEADNGCAFLETDMRAHMNPMRLEIIGQATRNLHSNSASCAQSATHQDSRSWNTSPVYPAKIAARRPGKPWRIFTVVSDAVIR